ncbi:MAG TPA: sugar ABC transporter permease [Trueperaceae bacterium]|jgi:ABC-type sugar transport system permease subunit
MLTRASTATWALLAPGLGLLLAFVVAPVFLTAWISLNEWSMYTPLSGMTFVGLENFASLFGDRVFNAALRNTLAYAGLCLVLILPLSFLLGQFLYRGLTRGRAALRSVLFVPYMIPTIAVAIIWGYLYSPLYGPLNQVLGAFGVPRQAWLGSVDTALPSLVIFNVWQTLGYYTVLVIAGLTQIPDVYYEAAVIDGANALQRTLHVTLPLLRRTLLFVVVIALINTVQVFEPVYVLTQGGPANATNVLSFQVYRSAFEFGQAGRASAMAFVLFLVLVAAVGAVMRLLRGSPEEGP